MSIRFLSYPYENLDLYGEKNREFEVALCEINQYYVVNYLQPVKHSSPDVCNIDYGAGSVWNI